MQLSQLVIKGNSKALNMVKSLIDNPMIISLDPPWAVSLEVEKHVQSGNADVSERPVIIPGKTSKTFLYDNVSPSSWSWQLSGYIPGNEQIEKTNLFTPIVQLNADLIRKAFKNGSIIIFKDTDQRTYTHCVIAALSVDTRADVRNKIPFSMTIREITELNSNKVDYNETEQKATPSGSIEDVGTTSTEKIRSTSTLKAGINKVLNFMS